MSIDVYEKIRVYADQLNAWSASDCPGATYDELVVISGNTSPAAVFNEAMARINRVVDLLRDGQPIKQSLDDGSFPGDRLPVYVAAFGAIKGKRVHDLMDS